MQILRHLGLAARFVSGYLIQLKPDVKPLDGPSGTDDDFTDLHAWAEVYLPGAGWIGLDPTSGLLAGEGHIPLACTPACRRAPRRSAARVDAVRGRRSASTWRSRASRETPRVTKPYTEEQWAGDRRAGRRRRRASSHAGDVRLTMGGEPTFVSIDDMDGAEWNTAALGPNKRALAERPDRADCAALRAGRPAALRPGQVVSRRAAAALGASRSTGARDGEPLWTNARSASPTRGATRLQGDDADAGSFCGALAERLGIDRRHVVARPTRTLPTTLLARAASCRPTSIRSTPSSRTRWSATRLARCSSTASNAGRLRAAAPGVALADAAGAGLTEHWASAAASCS